MPISFAKEMRLGKKEGERPGTLSFWGGGNTDEAALSYMLPWELGGNNLGFLWC